MTSRATTLAAMAALAAACRTSPDPGVETLEVELPDAYSGDVSSDPIDAEHWWTTFDAPSLDAAVAATLDGNFELRQAWTRLRQAAASSRIAGAPRIPTLDATGQVTYFDIDQRGGNAAFIPIRTGETFTLGLSLGYEVDLWGRIDSELQAAELEERATAADLEATGLALTGRAADAWFTIVERQALIDLVTDQIGVGEQLLELTENRFATGTGSALDVLQQRRQLEGTRAEVPQLEGEAERARYELSVLTGRPPLEVVVDAPDALPDLPPLPSLDVPGALLEHRPDVVAAWLRIESADANVAAAIADRYPRLDLSASYDFDSNKFNELFDRSITSLAANIVGPLVDGGRRKAEVERRRAVLDGAVDDFNLVVLTALREVEDALSLERRGVERLAVLDGQANIAREELTQARLRYAGGVDTYLQVLAAVQNLQTLERQLVNERAALLRARAGLHRALGGAWTDDLQPPARGVPDSPAPEGDDLAPRSQD